MSKPTCIKFTVIEMRDSEHVTLRVSAGKDEDHLQVAGTLRLTDNEYMMLAVGMTLATDPKVSQNFHQHCQFLCDETVRTEFYRLHPDED